MSHEAGQSPASFYRSPREALQAPPEGLVYVACLHVGTGADKPDFLAVVDVNPDSDEYGRNTRRRCRTPGTSSTTTAGTAAARLATGQTART